MSRLWAKRPTSGRSAAAGRSPAATTAPRPSRLPSPGELGAYKTHLKMRKLKHDLVVSIHDELSGTMLWKRLELDP